MSGRNDLVHRSIRTLVRLALLLTAVAAAGCGSTPTPATPVAGNAACAAGDAAGCEQALLTATAAELPKLLESYDATLRKGGAGGTTGDAPSTKGGWAALWGGLTAHPGRLAAVHDGGHAALLRGLSEDVWVLPHEMQPRAVAVERLVLALAAKAGRSHVLYLSGPASAPVAWHLFPTDPLAPHLPAVPAMVVGAPGRPRLQQDVALARGVQEALSAARKFDYVAAAQHADRLRLSTETAPADAEPTLRARYALSLLSAAGIALESEDRTEASARTEAPAGGAGRASALGELLRVKLTKGEPHAEWQRRRALIVASLPEDRARLLDAWFKAPDDCQEIPAPPMQHPSDLPFAPMLVRALASQTAAEGLPAGQLALDEWLVRYERLVRLVASTGTMWSYAPSVLAQRGELHGLSAAGTTTYKQVSDLGLRHLKALSKLAEQSPQRFRLAGLLPLIYAPGVPNDQALQDAVVELARSSVASKLDRATDAEGLFDAAFAGVMAVMSLPPAAQGSQLISLRNAFTAKLAGPVGGQRGWTVAGLHAAAGVLGLLTGQPERLRVAAPRAAESLAAGGEPLPYPQLAMLAVSGGRYGALFGTAALDPTVANSAMFTDPRKAARHALREALRTLSTAGPATAVERELLDDATELGDGLIALASTGLLGGTESQNEPQKVVCAAERSWHARPELRDPLQRLRRLRRRALDRRGFDHGDSPWLRRARLALTVLSDGLDVARRKDEVVFTLPDATVEKVLQDALSDWDDRTWAEAVQGGYLLIRAAIRSSPIDQPRLTGNVSRVLRALAQTFGSDARPEGPGATSLFAVLAKASDSAGAADDRDEVADLLVSYAERSYAEGADAQGDLLLFVALGIAVAREQASPQAALELAAEQDRPVRLPLVLNRHTSLNRDGSRSADPQPLIEAMRREQRRHCEAPDPASLIALRAAVHDVRAGKADRGLAALDRWLQDAERSGLVVPRLLYAYEETTADTVFKVEGSLSLASDFLTNSGSLQLKLGVRTSGTAGGRMDVRFADAKSNSSIEEAARLYAHVAALTAVYHFAKGNPDQASLAARRAVPAWAVGVRLGDERVPAGDRTATWAEDAPGVIAVAAQQALEAGRIFLAGDLWTLVLAAAGEDADDAKLEQMLDPVPTPLRGVLDLGPTIGRARASLRSLSAGFPCATPPKDLEKLLRADCRSYPRSLAYRIANGLPALPRLKRGAEIGKPSCAPLRSLDGFLAAADQQRYDPDAFTEAVTSLRKGGRGHDAAVLLARQRHPQHCSPALVAAARALAKDTELGLHLQADLLSLAANCSSGRIDEQLTADVLALDTLTQQLPMPLRNLKLTLFATRLALTQDHWQPLLELSRRADFVGRWLRFGPELATGALLIHHAAHVMSGHPVDGAATLPSYRLLCTTFPPADRGPTCHAIGVLRSGAPAAEKKRAAKDALATLMSRLTVPSQGAAASAEL